MNDSFGHPSTRSFVLIATYGRSGSTVVQALLGQMDQWCIRGENYRALGGLVDSYGAAHRSHCDFGDVATPLDNPWHGSNLISVSDYGYRLASAFVEDVLRPPSTTRVVGCKEIRLWHRPDQANDLLDFVLRFLAPTRIVFVQRDWKAVAKSSWWNALNPEEVQAYVKACDESMIRYNRKQPNETFLINHADLSPTSKRLRSLFEFLGESPNPAFVETTLSKNLTHGKRSTREALAGNLDPAELLGSGREQTLSRHQIRIGKWLLSIDTPEPD